MAAAQVLIDVELIERLVIHLNAVRAQMQGPDGESPPEWFGETELKGWIGKLNAALVLAGKIPL